MSTTTVTIPTELEIRTEFEDLGERTRLVQTMRFETPEQRDTTMQSGVEQGAQAGHRSIDALLKRIAHEA